MTETETKLALIWSQLSSFPSDEEFELLCATAHMVKLGLVDVFVDDRDGSIKFQKSDNLDNVDLAKFEEM